MLKGDRLKRIKNVSFVACSDVVVGFEAQKWLLGTSHYLSPGGEGGKGWGGMEDSFGDHMVFKGNGGRINHDQKSIKGGPEILQRGIR